jgi:hypothetical protein
MAFAPFSLQPCPFFGLARRKAARSFRFLKSLLILAPLESHAQKARPRKAADRKSGASAKSSLALKRFEKLRGFQTFSIMRYTKENGMEEFTEREA